MKGPIFMAQRVVVTLFDDIDGGEASETVAFGLDGTSYEIDLNRANAEKLRETLEPYLRAGRKRSASGRTYRRTSVAADPAAVDRYLADPGCGMDVTAGLFRDMLDGIYWGRLPAAVRRVEAGLPLLVISGGDDPVGDMGEGVNRTTQCYRQAGHEVRQILYPGLRHEILQETAHREKICEDIYQWMAQLPRMIQLP